MAKFAALLCMWMAVCVVAVQARVVEQNLLEKVAGSFFSAEHRSHVGQMNMIQRLHYKDMMNADQEADELYKQMQAEDIKNNGGESLDFTPQLAGEEFSLIEQQTDMYATRRARQQAAMEVVAPAPLIPVEHFDAAKLSPVAHHDHSAEMRFREIPQAAPQQAQTQENKDAGEMRFTETNAKAQTEAQTEAQTQAAATAEAKQGVKFIGKIRKFGQRLTGSDLKNHAQLIEDCMGCRFIWKQVEMDLGTARYVEDVQASFEHNCMEAQKTSIFYKVCEDMYDDMYAMCDDYMSQDWNVDEMCNRASLCREPRDKANRRKGVLTA